MKNTIEHASETKTRPVPLPLKFGSGREDNPDSPASKTKLLFFIFNLFITLNV